MHLGTVCFNAVFSQNTDQLAQAVAFGPKVLRHVKSQVKGEHIIFPIRNVAFAVIEKLPKDRMKERWRNVVRGLEWSLEAKGVQFFLAVKEFRWFSEIGWSTAR